MNGSIAYMAKHKARGVGIGQEGRIRARVVADFLLVRLQRGDGVLQRVCHLDPAHDLRGLVRGQ